MNKRGKITVLALIVMILLIGFFSFYSVLAVTDKNVKEFERGDKNYGKISILNNQNIKLAEYLLLENTDQCLINCYAEGTIILYTDGYLFTNLKFKNKNAEKEEIGTTGKGVGITGAAIGARLLSEGGIITILAMLCGTFIVFMIVRYKTLIRIKKK